MMVITHEGKGVEIKLMLLPIPSKMSQDVISSFELFRNQSRELMVLEVISDQ